MLVTITMKGKDSENLGFLLCKNPNRAQKFDVTAGSAYVFYPEVYSERTTCALLMNLNPIDLVKGKVGSNRDNYYTLFDYINDKPYAISSFMSTAINRIFSTAMSGKCKAKPELEGQTFDLEANLYSFPIKSSFETMGKIFESLGYKVEYTNFLTDDNFPEWGNSRYVNLKLESNTSVARLLNHLYILIPVFTGFKHYWVDDRDIAKLKKHGEEWLGDNPYKDYIISRYLKKNTSLISQFNEDEENPEEPKEKVDSPTSLRTKRMNAIKEVLLNAGVKTVLDIGCAEGKLESYLISEPIFTKLTGVDISSKAIRCAKKILRGKDTREITDFIISSAILVDSRFSGYEAIVLSEIIEHFEKEKLLLVEKSIFKHASPRMVVVTTPNREYNHNYKGLAENNLRNSDHKFEFTRKEFADWANNVAEEYGYQVKITGIGDAMENDGEPTQMGVFTR